MKILVGYPSENTRDEDCTNFNKFSGEYVYIDSSGKDGRAVDDNSINNTIQFDPAIISRLSFQHCPIKIRVSRFRDNDFTRPFHRRFLPSPREGMGRPLNAPLPTDSFVALHSFRPLNGGLIKFN